MPLETLIFAATAYCATALLYYFNHRCIYHGKPRGPNIIKKIWRYWASFHLIHHKHWTQEDAKTSQYIQIPLIGKILGASIVLIIVAITGNTGIGIGILAFFIVYGVRHGTIHGFTVAGIFKPAKKTSGYYKHHMSHHMPGGIKYNHSGVHPIIDKIFKTYHDPEDIVLRYSDKR